MPLALASWNTTTREVGRARAGRSTGPSPGSPDRARRTARRFRQEAAAIRPDRYWRPDSRGCFCTPWVVTSTPVGLGRAMARQDLSLRRQGRRRPGRAQRPGVAEQGCIRSPFGRRPPSTPSHHCAIGRLCGASMRIETCPSPAQPKSPQARPRWRRQAPRRRRSRRSSGPWFPAPSTPPATLTPQAAAT